MRPESMVIHGGSDSPSPSVVAVAAPIYQTASFHLRDLATAKRAYGDGGLGDEYTYSRYGNPTCDALERRVTALEGGAAGLAVASGSAAIALSVLNLAEQGDNIVSSRDLYGGTRTLFAHTLHRWGVEVRFVDPADPAAFVAAADERTRAFYGETLPNPSLRAFPVAEVADGGRRLGIPLIMDNTAAPLVCRPLEHGAAVVVYSATKYLAGHGGVLGGVVVDGGFPWTDHAERFPMLCTPDPSYHGAVWTNLARGAREPLRQAAYAIRMRRTLLRDLGPSLAPTSAAAILTGIETWPSAYSGSARPRPP